MKKQINDNLVFAKQMAAKSKGLNFYVTNRGIKRDYDLNKGSYEFKVYSTKEGTTVEDSKGVAIETPISQKMQDAPIKKAARHAKRGGSKAPIDSGGVE